MVFPTFNIEKSFWKKGKKLICGVDEVGRGCFAGPVVVGAVIFPENSIIIPGLADSKLLNPLQRIELEPIIKGNALCWGIAQIEVEEINEVGIGKATQLAFKKVIEELETEPDFIIIDAFYINNLDKKIQMPVKNGDKLSASIAAASVIAKVFRDNLMIDLDKEYPEYGFASHKGYGTKFHREAIKKHGLSPIHRTSFNLGKFLVN